MMRTQWVGPCAYTCYPEEGEPWEHIVVYQEDGQWYSTRWFGESEVSDYPLDELTGGVPIPIDEYTIPYQAGWKVVSHEDLDDTNLTYVKKPALTKWSPLYPQYLCNRLLTEIKALEACRGVVTPGLGLYKGVVVEAGRVTGIAWEHYLDSITECLFSAKLPGDLGFYTPAEALRHVTQAVEALHDINIVHGDVHVLNVLMDSNRRARLIDFDSAGKLSDPPPSSRSHYEEARTFESIRTYIDLYCLAQFEDELLLLRKYAAEMGNNMDLSCAQLSKPYGDERDNRDPHLSRIHWRSSDAPCRQFKLVVLLLDKPIENVLKQNGDWHSVVGSWLRRTIVAFSESIEDFILTVKSYDYFVDTWTPLDKIDLECANGLLLIGCEPTCPSSKGTRELQEWVRSVDKFVPKVKILGLGRGHTLLAAAFGGEVVTNPTNWAAGVRTLQVHENYQTMIKLDQPTDVPGITVATNMALHSMHGGNVAKLPPGFTDFCKYQTGHIEGMVSPAAGTLSEIHILSLASHPEFAVSNNIPLQYIAHLKSEGNMTEEEAEKAKANASQPEHGLAVGRMVLDWITDGFTIE